MITDADIKKLLKAVATKKDLKETRDDLVQKFMQVFATKQELNDGFERVREEMATKDQFNQVMDKLDAVYGEVRLKREDQIVHAEVHRKLEDRVKRLEQSA